MVKKIIETGLEGNDATGDPIRIAFDKVNDNFTELYSIFSKKSDGFRFTNLADYDKTRQEKLIANSIFMVNDGGQGEGDTILAKTLEGRNGIRITTTDTNKIIFEVTSSSLVNDANPQLGGNLDAQNLWSVYNVKDASEVDAVNLNSNIRSFVVTRGLGDDRYLNTIGDTATGPLRIRSEPANTTAYIKTISGFTSGRATFASAHGIIKEFNGAAYRYTASGDATNLTNNLVYYVRYYDNTTLGLYPTANDAINDTNRIIASGGSTQQLIDADLNLSIAGNYLLSEALPRSATVRRQGDTMDGVLLLNADPNESSVPLTAATKNYVDTTAFSSVVNIFVSTNGKDFRYDIPDYKRGTALAYAFKTINQAAFKAGQIIDAYEQELGPYQKPIFYGDGAYVSTFVRMDESNGIFTLNIRNDGTYVDARGSGGLASADIRAGLLIRGTSSGATVLINVVIDGITNNTEAYKVQYKKFKADGTTPITFISGEELEYGEVVNKLNVTLYVESGEYYENLPIRLPPNVSLCGDDMRRVIIRPRAGPSGSIWSDIHFRRDPTIDTLDVLNLMNVGQFAIGSKYKIFDLGTSNQARWNVLAGTTGQTYAINSIFTAAISGAYTAGTFVNGTQYVITSLGTTDWNALAGTSGVTYQVGSKFTATGVGSGTGKAYIYGGGTARYYEPQGYHYLTDPSKSLYSKIKIGDIGSGLENSQRILHANRSFIQDDIIAYVDYKYSTNVTNTAVGGAAITVASTTNLKVGMPVKFSATRITNATHTDNSGNIRIENITGLAVNDRIVFSGTPFGGLANNTTYYVKTVDNTGGNFNRDIRVSLTLGGLAIGTQSADGIMTATINTAVFGTIVEGTTYYIKTINSGTNAITISETLNGTAKAVSSASGNMTLKWVYDTDLCKRDIGSFIDAIGFDLIYGGYSKSLESAMSFFMNASAMNVIVDQLDKTLDSIGVRLRYLIKKVINLSSSGFDTNTTAKRSNTSQSVVVRNANGEVVSKESAYSDTTIDKLIQLIIDVLNKDESINYPKKNNEMDMLLLNDSNRVRTLSGQGHGGFMCVLDPTGQILAKSPYIQQCSSFSKSINAHCFAGGVFIDAFTGNLDCKITGKSTVDGVINLNVNQLFYRKPQTPCAFVINGVTYQIDYIGNYVAWNGTTGGTATFFINKNTPDTNGYLTTNRTIDVQTAGNRTMLASDFTQINDLGYGLLVTNNAGMEAVSVFTYYCYRAYYSLNGAQIRSLNGSCAYGTYALSAEGRDPTEVPTPVTLFKPTIKVLPTYFGAAFPDANKAGTLGIYVTISSLADDVPFNKSQVEIDFNDTFDTIQSPRLPILTYQIKNAVQADSTNYPTVYILNIATDGNTDTASLALKYTLTKSIYITVRNSRSFEITGLKTLQTTRPSNALTFGGDHNVYHILEYTSMPADDVSLTNLAAKVSLNEAVTYISLQLKSGSTNGGTSAVNRIIDIVPLSNIVGSPDEKDALLLNSGNMILGWGSQVVAIQSYTRVSDTLAQIVVYPALSKAALQLGTTIIYLRAGFKAGVSASITTQISLMRATGHDLADIGTGGYADSNYPNNIYGIPVTTKQQSQEVQEIGEGRVFYATTDQDGNIRFGKYFAVNQGTGSVTFAANVGISNLLSLQFVEGSEVSEFSVDATMGRQSAKIVPVELAISNFVSRRLGLTYTPGSSSTTPILASGGRLGPGFIAADGSISFGTELPNVLKTQTFNMNSHKIINLAAPGTTDDAANKGYVDSFLRLAGGVRSGVKTFSMGSTVSLPIDTVARVLLTGVVTITIQDNTANLIDGAHGLSIGSKVTIRDLTGASLTGLNTIDAVVTSVTSTSFTFVKAGADIATTTVSSAYVDTVSNIGMNSGKITSLADPTTDGDAANYKYVNIKANIGALNDVTLTDKTDNQILYYNNGSNKWINGFLTNSNVSSSAAIIQSKLSLKIATTYAAKPSGGNVADGSFILNKSYVITNVGNTNWAAVAGQAGTYVLGTAFVAATVGTSGGTGTANENIQANNGLSSFDSANFDTDNGFVSLKASGIPLSKLATMNTGVLGNTGGTAANPAVVTFPDALDGAIASPTTGGVIARASGSTATYTMVGYGSTNTASTLVQRDATNNFTAGTITANLTGTATNATNVGTTSDNTTVDGYVTFVTANSGNNPIKVGSMRYNASTDVLTTTASQAYYADLAEYYEADKEYNFGSVLMIGGDKEVTLSKGDGTTAVVGVVSENPAYLMNAKCPGIKLAVALQGRVPCKVVGTIQKGDLLVTSSIPGVATSSSDPKPGSIIGKALRGYNSGKVGIIEVLVGKH